MNGFQAAAVLAIFVLFAAIELKRGRFWAKEATQEDKWLDAVVMVVFPIMIVPTIFFTSYWLGTQHFAEYRDALAHWPWWTMAITLLLADDLTQYWWHRLSHSTWMWPFHRAHITRRPIWASVSSTAIISFTTQPCLAYGCRAHLSF